MSKELNIRKYATMYALHTMLMSMIFDNELTQLNVKKACTAYYDAMFTTLCIYCSTREIDRTIQATIDTVNRYLLKRYNDFYIEYYSDSATFECKQTFHITEQFRKSIKATYNLTAYINQYIDFYSEI